VLIWGGDGYERQGSVFAKTFALGAKGSFYERPTTTPFGPDGFFYLSDASSFTPGSAGPRFGTCRPSRT
jgi:hypothetical protein